MLRVRPPFEKKNVSLSKTTMFKSQDGILGVISNTVLLETCLTLLLVSSGNGIFIIRTE